MNRISLLFDVKKAKTKKTQHYAKILDSKISNDMHALKQKFSGFTTVVKDDLKINEG